jgi:hypothetical protein
MLFDTLRRIAAQLLPSTKGAPLSETASQRPSLLEFDPMWHGDHWQNQPAVIPNGRASLRDRRLDLDAGTRIRPG